MSDEGAEMRCIDWRRCFQCLDILRSFRMAIHPASLILCLAALAATFWLGVLVDQFPAPVGNTEAKVAGGSFFENMYHIGTVTLWGDWALPYVGGATWDDFFAFLMTPASAAYSLVALAVEYWKQTPLFAFINTVLALGIWALVGTAVTRMAAVRVAREESVPAKQAVCFAVRKWPSAVTSPLIPFGVLVFLALVMGAFAGVTLMVPYVGEWLVGLLFFLPLLLSVVLALIFVGGAFSVGLQWPTIAAEGSDAFDAISRSISYISSRPWKYLFSTVFSLIYGCATFILVKFVAFATLFIAHEAISMFSWGEGDLTEKISRLWDTPTLAHPWPEPGFEQYWSEPAASCVFMFWIWIALGLMMAFLVSFFFCSQTVIYFLMRKAVDATDTEEVYLEEGEEEELPLEDAGEEAGPEAPETQPSAPPPAAEPEPPAEETGGEDEGGEGDTEEGEKEEET